MKQIRKRRFMSGGISDVWRAEYRAASLARAAADALGRATGGAAQATVRTTGRIANVLAPETTRWGAALAQRIGNASTLLHVPKQTPLPPSREEMAKEAEEVWHAARGAYGAVLSGAPPTSHELVGRMLMRTVPGAPLHHSHPARELCERLLDRLAGKSVTPMDAVVVKLIARDLPRSSEDDARRMVTMLWQLVEQYDEEARERILSPRDTGGGGGEEEKGTGEGLQAERHASTARVSEWARRRGEEGFVEEATRRIEAHLLGAFGTSQPPLTCPSKTSSGSVAQLRLTPAQEVTRFLLSPSTGPHDLSFLLYLPPGSGKTYAMLAMLGEANLFYEAQREADPALPRPPMLLLAVSDVQKELQAAIRDFGSQFRLTVEMVEMIDIRYAGDGRLDTIRRIAQNPRSSIVVDEAHELVDLPVDKQRNKAGVKAPYMWATARKGADILTRRHPECALLLATGTPHTVLSLLVAVLMRGSPHAQDGLFITCDTSNNPALFPRLYPGTKKAPSPSAGAPIGTFAPLSAQSVLQAPLVTRGGGGGESVAKQEAPAERASGGGPVAGQGADLVVQALHDLTTLPKDEEKYLPVEKYKSSKAGNCTASYIGFLVSRKTDAYKAAVRKRPFALAPKLAACAYAVLRMHYDSKVGEEGTRVASVGVEGGLAMITLQRADGSRHAVVRSVLAGAGGERSVGASARVRIGSAMGEGAEKAATLVLSSSSDAASDVVVSNSPTPSCRPRQLIMLDVKHGLDLFPMILQSVHERLFSDREAVGVTSASVVRSSLMTLFSPDPNAKEKVRREFNDGASAYPWLAVDASAYSEAINLPGPRLNPVCLQHYVSVPVDSDGNGSISKFVQGMRRTARLCMSREGWVVHLLLYTLAYAPEGGKRAGGDAPKRAQSMVDECSDRPVSGLERGMEDVAASQDGTPTNANPSDPIQSFSITRDALAYLNADQEEVGYEGGDAAAAAGQSVLEGVVDAAMRDAAAADPSPYGIDVKWVRLVADKCAEQEDEMMPCVQHSASACPAPTCRIEAGRCASRPDGSVCDDLVERASVFDAWSNALTERSVSSLDTPSHAAVRSLIDCGAIGGADASNAASAASSSEGPQGDSGVVVAGLRRVTAEAMRIGRLGRYMPYFDADAVTPAARQSIRRLVEACERVVAPHAGLASTADPVVDVSDSDAENDAPVEARTLACAALVHAWSQRPEFHFGDTFVQHGLPSLVSSVGDALFRLGTPRYGSSGEWWYDNSVLRALAFMQSGATQHTSQLARNVQGGYSNVLRRVRDAGRRVRDLARRVVGMDATVDQEDVDLTLEWASSPHSVFALLLTRRMMGLGGGAFPA